MFLGVGWQLKNFLPHLLISNWFSEGESRPVTVLFSRVEFSFNIRKYFEGKRGIFSSRVSADCGYLLLQSHELYLFLRSETLLRLSDVKYLNYCLKPVFELYIVYWLFMISYLLVSEYGNVNCQMKCYNCKAAIRFFEKFYLLNQ